MQKRRSPSMKSFINLPLSLTHACVHGEEKERRREGEEKEKVGRRKFFSQRKNFRRERDRVREREREILGERGREKEEDFPPHASLRDRKISIARERESEKTGRGGKRVREKEEKAEEGSSSTTEKFPSREIERETPEGERRREGRRGREESAGEEKEFSS